jgi:hypothetical protein
MADFGARHVARGNMLLNIDPGQGNQELNAKSSRFRVELRCEYNGKEEILEVVSLIESSKGTGRDFESC